LYAVRLPSPDSSLLLPPPSLDPLLAEQTGRIRAKVCLCHFQRASLVSSHLTGQVRSPTQPLWSRSRTEGLFHLCYYRYRKEKKTTTAMIFHSVHVRISDTKIGCYYIFLTWLVGGLAQCTSGKHPLTQSICLGCIVSPIRQAVKCEHPYIALLMCLAPFGTSRLMGRRSGSDYEFIARDSSEEFAISTNPFPPHSWHYQCQPFYLWCIYITGLRLVTFDIHKVEPASSNAAPFLALHLTHKPQQKEGALLRSLN